MRVFGIALLDVGASAEKRNNNWRSHYPRSTEDVVNHSTGRSWDTAFASSHGLAICRWFTDLLEPRGLHAISPTSSIPEAHDHLIHGYKETFSVKYESYCRRWRPRSRLSSVFSRLSMNAKPPRCSISYSSQLQEPDIDFCKLSRHRRFEVS